MRSNTLHGFQKSGLTPALMPEQALKLLSSMVVAEKKKKTPYSESYY